MPIHTYPPRTRGDPNANRKALRFDPQHEQRNNWMRAQGLTSLLFPVVLRDAKQNSEEFAELALTVNRRRLLTGMRPPGHLA